MGAHAATVAMLAFLVWGAGADVVRAQQPDTRLIDTEPRVVIRPPESDGPAPRDPRMPALPDPPGSEHERSLALEIEMKERREQRDGGSEAPSWIAAAVFIATAGVFVLVLGWASRRRDR
jgi:hypothetical protein